MTFPKQYHTVHLTFNADTLQDLTATTAPKFSHLDRKWLCIPRIHDGHLSVLVRPVDLSYQPTVVYGVSFICDDRFHEHPPEQVDIPTMKGIEKVIPWELLCEQFCKDGEFTLDIKFPIAPDQHERVHVCFPSLTLATADFKDVWVACKNAVDKVHCNKVMITANSKTMRSAFSDATSAESLSDTFTIGHHCATAVNVQLFVRSMYEGWINELMDAHAFELFILADYYQSDKIAAIAERSLTRQLSADRFWDTVAVAVMLQERRPKLIDMCARFAHSAPNDWNELVNRTDRGWCHEIAAVAIANATMHKS